ncbi:DNA/RNA non-specific endonuclease [Phyllobacterium endophyticum]|uniref:DNA/RNA non-specific endonuclease n=1 Tax=Phyllobacterium endophyticum TaxID=1149773 RepID=UPI0016509FCD
MPDLGDQLSNLSPSSLNPSGGRGSGTTSWITEQSGLVSKHRMDVEVKGDTLIDAGKIVSDDGDLKLKTATLTHKDFEGEKRFEGGSVDLSIDVTGKFGKPDPDNPTRNDTLEGSYKLDDTRQKVRATVGPGTIEITDPQKQAKLEEAGTTPPLSELNRDPDAAMEITRDKHVDLEVYLSDNSVRAAMDTLKTVGSTVSDALAGMLNQRKDVDPKTKAAAFSLIAEVLKENVSLDELKACGKQGFNPFNWIVTPAYAGGVCDEFPKVVIDLCLDGMDTLRNVLVHGGADALAYLSRRIQDDPKGFNDLVRVLNLLPSNLAMAPLEKSLNDEITRNGGDPDIISKYVGTFLREQAAAVERGELSPEAAAAIAIGVTALVAKLTPKLVRGKVVSKVIQSAKVVFEAAERKGVGELARPSPNSVGHVVLGDLDELGRPSGVLATITKDMLNTGSSAKPTILPPGFGGVGEGHARGHLLAKLLGGTGSDSRNLVAMLQNPANHPTMSSFEAQIAAAVRQGEVVNFRAVPVYIGSNPMPVGITLTARGSGGFDLSVSIRN